MDTLLKRIFIIVTVLGVVSQFGCGHYDNGEPPLNKAVIVLSTALASGATDQIGSVDVVIELPAGVTVQSDPSSGAISNGINGVLRLSGEAARFASQPNAVTPVIMGKYTPATSTNKANVALSMIVQPNNSSGLNPGEFATLECDRSPDVHDTSIFRLTSVLIANILGTKIYDSTTGSGPASATINVSLL
ncbi:MAG: hypothetical protein PHI31_16660 [Desulfuromonadaceae bacterium]|nr:hypothetical protein [Desulfuromonadaceae bacterium]